MGLWAKWCRRGRVQLHRRSSRFKWKNNRARRTSRRRSTALAPSWPKKLRRLRRRLPVVSSQPFFRLNPQIIWTLQFHSASEVQVRTFAPLEMADILAPHWFVSRPNPPDHCPKARLQREPLMRRERQSPCIGKPTASAWATRKRDPCWDDFTERIRRKAAGKKCCRQQSPLPKPSLVRYKVIVFIEPAATV